MEKVKRILILFCLLLTALASYAVTLGENPHIEYNNGVYHVTLCGKKLVKQLRFVSSDKLLPNREAHANARARFTVNAGFFDPKNQKTISYIITDRNTAADPLFNENLMSNPVLRQNLDKIINRTEFRMIDCDGKTEFEITAHNTALDFACSIVTSAQGGPMILPELRLEEEFFILKDENGKIIRESASVLQKTARTIIALKGQEIHVLVITNENPMTIYEVRDLCKQLGFDYAMAFDGGSSTSMNYKDSIEVVSTGDSAGRMLKSFLILQ